MARRRSTKRSRAARKPRARALASLRERTRLPELEQHHLDLAGLGLVALGAFFAFVMYFGSDGGEVGGALAVALRFLLGGVAYLVPVALIGAGGVLVLRPVLPSTRPFRAGAVCLLLALALGLAGRMFGLGPGSPARHGYLHPGYMRHHGGLVGDAVYWAARSLFQDFGAHLVFVFLLAAGILLLSGASVAGLLRVTRAGMASSARRLRRSVTSLFERREEPRAPAAPPVTRRDRRPPDVEPIVRATHVEAPPREPEDESDRDGDELGEAGAGPPAADDVEEVARAPFPRFERASEPDAEPPDDADQPALTPQGARRSGVTEAVGIDYDLPSTSVLERSRKGARVDRAAQERTGRDLVEALRHLRVEAELVGAVTGPHITRYELRLAPGITMSKVAKLGRDLAYALAATEIRILAPIPGKQAVGVEVPNADRRIVHLGDVFQGSPAGWSPLTVWLGKDIAGNAIGTDLAKQPHVLVAGTTGSGKSGCVNAMLCSILLRQTPNEVRLVLVDPKHVELNHYEHIPHLLTPVVTSPRLAANVLANLLGEMEQRYMVMSQARARNLVELNRVREAAGERALPYILCVIDELADLMMIAPHEVEDAIIRLAQKSRAVGIHLLLATQRPSADVITGMIKANVPARIAFAVASLTDSRVILDQNGAEALLGQGDMLFRPASEARPARIQGAFVTEAEIERLTDHWRGQGEPDLKEGLLEAVETDGERSADDAGPDSDDLLPEAIATVVQLGSASTSMLQRRLRVGYTRAGRLIDMMERRGVISGYEGSKARQVLISEADLPRVLSAPDEPVGAGEPT
ncbi:MAG: DNA translocase FtsK [Actinobacteria bacterium]|nr:DNA translocase FtsK [Actinomycetota bacterium]